jgi:hypothetical protein
MPDSDDEVDRSWAIQPLRDAGLDGDEITTHLDRLIVERMDGKTHVDVDQMFGDQTADVQAAWQETLRRLSLLE